MENCKRAFKRVDLPVHLKFRSTYGAKEYFPAVTSNISSNGFALKADDFRFILYEYLEFLVDLNGNNDPVVLFGDVVWKKQDGQMCTAGVKFRMKDHNKQKEAVEKILAESDISLSHIYDSDPGNNTEKKFVEHSFTNLPDKLGVIKEYYDGGARCKVTFRLLRESARNIQHVTIVGDFNGWDTSRSPMIKLENGDFVITIDLDSRREYKFKYLMDGSRWENDWYADRYAITDSGTKASVIVV